MRLRFLVAAALVLVVMCSAPTVHAIAGPITDAVSRQVREGSAQNNTSWGTCQSQTGLFRCGLRPSDDTFADNLFPTITMKGSIPLILIVQDMPTIPVGKDYVFLKFEYSGVLPSMLISSHARPECVALVVR